ncbi:MAG: SGNH/GDSL hydrolase family protein [Planctomycetota bacterium]|nr:SGNH/GDSL hydrolase family protein [Planctomycetota bacterium]
MIRNILIIAAGLLLPLAAGEVYLHEVDPYHFGEKEDWSQYGAEVLDASSGAVRLSPNARASYLGNSTVISPQGWRSPPFEPKKPAGVYRILVVGGSVPYGWGVADGDEFPRLLERELNARGFAGGKRVEVINTGVPGWKLPEVGGLLQGEAFSWQPDMVMLLVVSTDAHLSSGGESRSAFLTGPLRRCRLLWAIENRYLFGTPGTSGRPYDHYENLPEEGLERVAHALSLFVGACREKSAVPVVIDTLNSEITRQRCRDLSVQRIEAYTPWATRRKWEIAVTDAHPNAEGHQYYAALILAALRDR